MLNLFTMNVVFLPKVKMLLFYNVQTINLTFISNRDR